MLLQQKKTHVQSVFPVGFVSVCFSKAKPRDHLRPEVSVVLVCGLLWLLLNLFLGNHRGGNGLCVWNLEVFPPSTSSPWAAGIFLM